MIGYTPIFSKIVDSSLWDEPDYVVKIFITMIAKKDGDNIVRGNAYNISKWSRKTEKEVLDALKILSSPDKRRLEPQQFDGRRVERVDEGWLILNGQVYQDMMRDINRRAYKARKEKEYRGKKSKIPKSQDKPPSGKYRGQEAAAVKAHENGDDETFDRIAATL